ncbi:DUF7882 family protein [Microbacterium flavescens]|uniref:DUF7882 family protein n=1 Tax=Microbacterium flavescens TaxID=69366 RepID=UPI001BDE6CBD|nr:hypothetical protein [Microbacterium flavescens]
MGQLFYDDSPEPIEIDDRLLAHLKVVVFAKLRRREPLTLSWAHSPEAPGGSSTLWVHPSIPLRFIFDTPERPELNREWLRVLAASANLTHGIQLARDDDDGDGGSLSVPPDQG